MSDTLRHPTRSSSTATTDQRRTADQPPDRVLKRRDEPRPRPRPTRRHDHHPRPATGHPIGTGPQEHTRRPQIQTPPAARRRTAGVDPLPLGPHTATHRPHRHRTDHPHEKPRLRLLTGHPTLEPDFSGAQLRSVCKRWPASLPPQHQPGRRPDRGSRPITVLDIRRVPCRRRRSGLARCWSRTAPAGDGSMANATAVVAIVVAFACGQ